MSAESILKFLTMLGLAGGGRRTPQAPRGARRLAAVLLDHLHLDHRRDLDSDSPEYALSQINFASIFVPEGEGDERFPSDSLRPAPRQTKGLNAAIRPNSSAIEAKEIV
jgi:hypothetical protein